MASNSTWKRDILAVPFLVGLLLLIAGYFVPKLWEKGKRISYTIDGPTAYLNPNAVGTAKIEVGGVKYPNVFGYKVRLWNSGSVPLASLPVLFSFDTTNADFKVFNVTHTTTPKREFGAITETNGDPFSKRFVYELLNPKDEDVMVFLTSLDVPLSVYSKSEDLKVVPTQSKTQAYDFSVWTSLLVAVVGAFASLLTFLFKFIEERKTGAAELKVNLVGVNYTPKIIARGQRLKLEYTIESQFDIVEGVWLGAHIALPNKKMINNPEEDHPISIKSGRHEYSRFLTVPVDTTPGTYKLDVGVWHGIAGNATKSKSISRRIQPGDVSITS
jgi:hypothetical protein